MDLHQLNYFQVLAKIGNVSRAAEELVLSQSALSRSISRLEENSEFPYLNGKVVVWC
jgi:DNA-binding transcriptional LysR family regulator